MQAYKQLNANLFFLTFAWAWNCMKSNLATEINRIKLRRDLVMLRFVDIYAS